MTRDWYFLNLIYDIFSIFRHFVRSYYTRGPLRVLVSLNLDSLSAKDFGQWLKSGQEPTCTPW